MVTDNILDVSCVVAFGAGTGILHIMNRLTCDDDVGLTASHNFYGLVGMVASHMLPITLVFGNIA
jgi:hypothetical protein